MTTDLREQVQSTLGSAYAIERELGGGGMSRVFVATEVALGRRIVVKVLPQELSSAVGIERFKREILLAASLQHACIVPVHAAGRAGEVLYSTMPFVEGESLRARLACHGQLPVAEAVKILRDTSAAVGCTHAHGFVHCDLKPENVLLSGGYALVTCFGVAKALSAATNAPAGSLTSAGFALGTVSA